MFSQQRGRFDTLSASVTRLPQYGSIVGPMPISDARLYLCTDSRSRQGDFEQFLDAAFAGGVDIIQLRDKTIQAGEELDLLQILRSVAERHSKLWSVNDRADLAAAADAPVFHVGQQDIPPSVARRFLGSDVAVGLSSNTAALAAQAMDNPELDYFCTGPIWATPTKPGRAAVGLDLIRSTALREQEQQAAGRRTNPWFAIGGIDLANVDEVIDAGARRVVVVRAITDASDPTEAATRILSRLPEL